MFRFEDNVAKYLVNESRDFQLMTRIYDILYMGQRFSVKTMQELNNPSKCKSTILHLLANKVGFFTDKYIHENALRSIVSAFRSVLKKKGTLYGVLQAVVAVLKVENTLDPPVIVYTDHIGNSTAYELNEDVLEVSGTFVSPMYQCNNISIKTSIRIQNVVALEEFLRYVVPFGYTVTIEGGGKR